MSGLKKALVVYWSKTGNTEKVALAIKEGLEAASFEVDVKKPKEAADVDYFDYDLVCVGSPSYQFHPVELIAEKTVDVKGLITHRFRLADFEKALQTANNPAEKPLKVVLTA